MANSIHPEGKRGSKESSFGGSIYSGVSGVSSGRRDSHMSKVSQAAANEFQQLRKTRQSVGAYTSLFGRKLLPPLGFYRESDKYAQLKAKFKDDDPFKADALEEMWFDYQKYQVRKRFRWPPNLVCKKFFWTTGYYADYQKQHRATKLRKPGEDSSDEEFIDPTATGQYMVAAGGDDDINIEEFERYREAKKQAAGNPGFVPRHKKRSTRFNQDRMSDTGNQAEVYKNYLVDRRPTVARLFEPEEKKEVETILEYAVIPNPNKNKMDNTEKKDKDSKRDRLMPAEEETLDGLNLEELEAGATKKLVTNTKTAATRDLEKK